jgi:hypothetical protein
MRTTCPSDLEPVVKLVCRLRLDGHVVDMAEFEAMVLHGELAPPPPPDWLEFERPPKCRQRS